MAFVIPQPVVAPPNVSLGSESDLIRSQTCGKDLHVKQTHLKNVFATRGKWGASELPKTKLRDAMRSFYKKYEMPVTV